MTMDYNMFYPPPPTSATSSSHPDHPPYQTQYPAEHNVYISNYFLGSTRVEGGYLYPPHPPSDLSYPPHPPSDLSYHHPAYYPEGGSPPYKQPPAPGHALQAGLESPASFDVWKHLKEDPEPAQPSCYLYPAPTHQDLKPTPHQQTAPSYKEEGEDTVKEAGLVLQIQAAHLRGDHAKVMEMIATICFSTRHHDTLQELWLSAVYGFAKLKRGKSPNAVDRYRLRKKYPFPATVWDGEKTLYCYKQSARDLLEEFYCHNKYPTPLQKRELSEKCELQYMQVCNWFKNKRMRGKEQSARTVRGHS